MIFEPRAVIGRLATALPREFAARTYVAGSLAAGFHFQDRLERHKIRTKDADIVVHAVGAHGGLGEQTETLLAQGWVWNLSVKFSPGTAKTKAEELPFIRLFPPGMRDFFIEFLGQPKVGQRSSKSHGRVVVHGAHFAVPIFRFLGLTSWNLRDTGLGLRYADPAMMSLSNLLSHPTLGTARMESPIGGRLCLRSAKDLGRVLAISRLTPRDEQRDWVDRWVGGLRKWFPKDWRKLGATIGSGLRELAGNTMALLEAHHTAVHLGLLPGRDIPPEKFAELVDLLENDVRRAPRDARGNEPDARVRVGQNLLYPGACLGVPTKRQHVEEAGVPREVPMEAAVCVRRPLSLDDALVDRLHQQVVNLRAGREQHVQPGGVAVDHGEPMPLVAFTVRREVPVGVREDRSDLQLLDGLLQARMRRRRGWEEDVVSDEREGQEVEEDERQVYLLGGHGRPPRRDCLDQT